MKQRFSYLTMAVAALLTAACSQEDFNTTYLNDPDAVQISAQVGSGEVSGGFVTRSTPEGNTTEEQGKFKEGDRISVSADAQGPVVYQLDDEGNWAPEGSSFLKWETNSMNFTAYYPASAGTNTENFTVPADQSDADKIGTADYMTYPTTPIARASGSNGVTLQMKRKMARIVVKTTLQNQFTGYEVTDIKVHSNTKGYTDGSVTSGDITVKAYKHTANTFYALLSPTTAATGSYFIDVTVTKGNDSATLQAKGIPATEAGKSYTVNLKVGKVVATVGSISIQDWSTGDTIIGGEAAEKGIPYVTFSSETATTFSMNFYDFTLGEGEYFEYAVGNGDWTPFTTSVSNIPFGGENGALRLRGKSSQGTAVLNEHGGAPGARIRFPSEGPIDCTGDIRTLIDYEHYATASTADARFAYLFENANSLKTAPRLPATTLASKCYSGMFYGCKALIAAPALPATNLDESCYSYMFYGCTTLATAPALPATNLAMSCYYSMFQGCTALTAAPALPATTLASNCYSGMFNGCTTLATAPALPATTLAEGCYHSMFNGCTTLATVPAQLPATTLEPSCYKYMFYNCDQLTTAPEILATTLASECCNNMFFGCARLTKAPTQLPATTLAQDCYGAMFSACDALETAPVLPAATLVQGCYTNMFSNCKKLSRVTMKATNVPTDIDYLNYWLGNAGSEASSRTLTLANESVYNTLAVDTKYLPDLWKKDQATINYVNSNNTTE